MTSQSAPLTPFGSKHASPAQSRQVSPTPPKRVGEPPNAVRVGMKVIGYLAGPVLGAAGYIARGIIEDMKQEQARAAQMAAQREAYEKGQRHKEKLMKKDNGKVKMLSHDNIGLKCIK